MAARLLRGETQGQLVDIGWKSVGLLELSVLPSIGREAWVPVVEATDAILVWGGDPLFLAHWLKESGLAEVLQNLVYVGTSAGAIATAEVFGETYTEPRTAAGTALASEEVVFATPEGNETRTMLTAAGIGLVDFAVIPHFENPNHPDACGTNAELWASKIPAPVYAIDDQTAVVVRDGDVEVVSEGAWRLFDAP
jgi:dipeptidase E